MTRRQLRVIFKDSKLFASTTLILVGLFATGYYFFRTNVNTKSDLIEVNGKLNNFYFSRYGIKNDHYNYYLYLDEYNNKFQIIADLIDCFNKDSFEKNLKIGDSLKILIPQSDSKNLNNQNKIKLFGIYGKEKTFLDSESSIKNYNNKQPLVGGLIFIIIGGLIFYFNSEKLSRIEKINKR